MPTGPSVHYVAGSGHRPVPMATDLTTPMASHQQRPPKPRGLDWSQLTPRCKGCGEQSSRLNRDDKCPSCADPGTANVPTKAQTKAKPATCTECQRDSRFLQNGLCPLCRAETTTIVLYDEPKLPQEGNQGKPTTRSSAPGAISTSSTTGRAPEAGPSTPEMQDPPVAQETRPAAAGGTSAARTDLAWPTRPERIWDILVATEDCTGDPIAAMMRRAAIATLEALWLHWRLHHKTPEVDASSTEAPSPAAVDSPDADLGHKPPTAEPTRKGKPGELSGRPTAGGGAEPGNGTPANRHQPHLRPNGRAYRKDRIELDLAALAADYEAGATLRDLANSYGHRIGVIRDRLADAGVTIRKAASVASAEHVVDATEWATIRTGYAEGISLDVLAHRHHLRISRIRDHLTEHGIHIRDKGEAAQALVDRIRAHGLDQHAVKTWALEQGMITKISRGNINGRALEAYIAAHPTTTTEENPA